MQDNPVISLPKQSGIKSIKLWQEENSKRVMRLIQKTACAKYRNGSSFLYPCVCPLRYRSCIEIEFYYKVLEIIKIHEQQSLYKEAIDSYNAMPLNKTGWYIKYKDLEKVLVFSPKIQIITNNASYEKFIFQLDQEDFKYTLALKELFEKILYQEE
ncbi:hypothetical protein [Myroides marinus]|uniref:hypothetical protein n=1 Tax=Myroides marinus TaxID=703342 RepID=UPI002575F191|nr:hypothetical protein [Myroides marinus]MDM1377032.1 hypothetical protein [Myroides marinus]